ncbi:hematopoietic SH2 domain-containing protein homolog [Syngnathus typhle]|uniref:hematopoietic SH2 domain-containing protein homolog n=1 Tax=Syngnathus typhle TaxID=161592 RepID=UPI002A6B6F0A|nr:hematopoietic SH2 domain-containing protein homolog [Syngnathus typhle]
MTALSPSPQPQNNTWFVASQSTWIQNGVVPEWFYWRISRKAAEELLTPKPPGSFLIRISESRVGYALSYRAEGCFRHFMIEAKQDGTCAIVGEKRAHPSLHHLVDFHRKVPIAAHNELLTFSCAQIPNSENKHSGNNPVQSTKSLKVSKGHQDDQKNADNLSQTQPIMPIPKTRKRYITDNKPLKTPSENLPTPPNTEKAPAPTVEHRDETIPTRNPSFKTEELQDMSWEQLFDAALSAYNDEGESLPQEYSPPPPFAPGYQAKEA